MMVLLAVVWAGCIGARPSAPQAATTGVASSQTDGAALEPGSNAVVAFLDSGINPYHKSFRDDSPQARLYPGEYIPGYPPDAMALNLTLDAPTWEDAVEKDCPVWGQLKAGKLYWIPGTKIVGAMYFGEAVGPECQAGILDRLGHGTMVASRGASNDFGACRECRIVMVQWLPAGVSLASIVAALNWVGSQSAWIDAQSNSYGPILPAIGPSQASNLLMSDGTFVRAIEAAAERHLAFWAAGNGILSKAGLLGHPTLLLPQATPHSIQVGGHDSGRVVVWTGQGPHLASDVCYSWAAHHDSLDASDEYTGGGTSAAAPFAAGGAARMLLEARRLLLDTETGVDGGAVARGTPPLGLTKGPLADGVLTLAEWRDLLFKTATPRPIGQWEDGPPCDGTHNPLEVLDPALPVLWKDVPSAFPEYALIGYGAVDNQSQALAQEILLGRAPLPHRSATDGYFAQDATVRERLYQIWSSVP